MSKIRIIQLSDPHFGTVIEKIQNALVKTVQDLSPNLIVMTGDITQRAHSSEFQEAVRFKQSLGSYPFMAIPGNHDIPLSNLFARAFSPYRGYLGIFSHSLQEHWSSGDIEVGLLNSTSRFRLVQGALRPAAIAPTFKNTVNKKSVRILGFHHPMDCAKHVDDQNLLKNRDEVMEACTNARVDLILGGHIHDPYTTLSSGRYPSQPRPMIITVAGTSLSWRTRANAPNSFHQIDIESGLAPEITVTRHDLNHEFEFKFKEQSRFKRTENNGWISV